MSLRRSGVWSVRGAVRNGTSIGDARRSALDSARTRLPCRPLRAVAFGGGKRHHRTPAGQ
eukprot:5573055-Prymnesium_polylepis.1